MKIFNKDDDPVTKAEDFDKEAREAKERGEEAKRQEQVARWGPGPGR